MGKEAWLLHYFYLADDDDEEEEDLYRQASSSHKVWGILVSDCQIRTEKTKRGAVTLSNFSRPIIK